MENDNKKIITVCFVATGFISFIIARVIFEFLAGNIGFFGKLWSETSVQHAIPVSIGILSFVILEFNKKITVWADEVVTEIRKVVWPSRKDTTGLTIVTCVMVVVSGLILGVFDFVSTESVKLFINLK